MADPWWREGVLYQIYPGRSPTETVTVSATSPGWLRSWTTSSGSASTASGSNPIHPSPNVDWGYDVADYTGVHPDLGTLADVEAAGRGSRTAQIRVLLDLVPNHTSDRHPWFRDRPDFYVWADEVPNNWQAIFGGGSAWALDDERGRYYLHNFARSSPISTGGTRTCARSSTSILRFWLDRGVAGFRINVAHGSDQGSGAP